MTLQQYHLMGLLPEGIHKQYTYCVCFALWLKINPVQASIKSDAFRQKSKRAP